MADSIAFLRGLHRSITRRDSNPAGSSDFRFRPTHQRQLIRIEFGDRRSPILVPVFNGEDLRKIVRIDEHIAPVRRGCAFLDSRFAFADDGIVGFGSATPTRPARTAVPLHSPTGAVSRPRANLTRYHGLFAPSSPFRQHIVPAAGKPRRKTRTTQDHLPMDESTQIHDTSAITESPTAPVSRAQRLKRVLNIDITGARSPLPALRRSTPRHRRRYQSRSHPQDPRSPTKRSPPAILHHQLENTRCPSHPRRK